MFLRPLFVTDYVKQQQQLCLVSLPAFTDSIHLYLFGFCSFQIKSSYSQALATLFKNKPTHKQ